MPYVRKWIKSGPVIEAEEYFCIRTPKHLRRLEIGERARRSKNRSPTTEQQKKLNNRNSVKHLCRLINANYGRRDLFVTNDFQDIPLLPDGEPDLEELKNRVGKYLRKLRKIYKDAGVTFKYIWVIEQATEQGRKRPHVHLLLPRISLDAVADAWEYGGCTPRRLDATKDFKGIAAYLSKDPTLGMNHKKRWGASQNLEQPKEDCRKIEYPGGPIRAPKGFKEIVDKAYWSDITGLIRYVRYIRIDGDDFGRCVLKDARGAPDEIEG